MMTAGKFQSTLPVGEATTLKLVDSAYHGISIHASRGGSDLQLSVKKIKL